MYIGEWYTLCLIQAFSIAQEQASNVYCVWINDNEQRHSWWSLLFLGEWFDMIWSWNPIIANPASTARHAATLLPFKPNYCGRKLKWWLHRWYGSPKWVYRASTFFQGFAWDVFHTIMRRNYFSTSLATCVLAKSCGVVAGLWQPMDCETRISKGWLVQTIQKVDFQDGICFAAEVTEEIQESGVNSSLNIQFGIFQIRPGLGLRQAYDKFLDRSGFHLSYGNQALGTVQVKCWPVGTSRATWWLPFKTF